MGVDPAPDLIVEVVATHPLGDTVEVYRRFGVRELWIGRRSQITILVLARTVVTPNPVRAFAFPS